MGRAVLISIRSILILGILAQLSIACTHKSQDLQFKSLNCELLKNPVGIQQMNPEFSWIIQSEAYNCSQSKYHILVASSPDLLEPGKADMWDSQEVSSSQSIFIPYKGVPLQATIKYWWRVRIRDQDKKESVWSPLQSFEMGLLQESDWHEADWISLGKDTRESEYRYREVKTQRMEAAETKTSFPAAYFRKELISLTKVKSARAYICALGCYELYVNGSKISDHVLDPVPTSYDHHAMYVTHDITAYLNEGNNTLGYWEKYTSNAMQQYRNPLWLKRVGHIDWVKLTREVQRDIEIAGEDLQPLK